MVVRILVAAAGVALAPAFASEELRVLQREHLWGDWNGLRPWLEARGTTFELVYKSEAFWNSGGGIAEGGKYRADLSLTIELNTADAGWWEDGSFLVHLQGQHGDGITEDFVGDFQVLSNLDDQDFAQVSEFWYRHDFSGGKLWTKLGKLEANADFAYVEHGLEFLNSSPGFSPTIPLVTYPDPDWGVVVGIEPADWFSMNIGVYQGRPDGSRSIGQTIDALYGPMVMVEPAIHYTIRNKQGHLRLGSWWNGDRFERLALAQEKPESTAAERIALARAVQTDGLLATFLTNLIAFVTEEATSRIVDKLFGDDAFDDYAAGLYFTWDQVIYDETPNDPDDKQGIGAFAQYGRSGKDNFEAHRYYGAGIEWVGAISGRDRDVLGLGVFHIEFSDRVGHDKSSETTIELFYRYEPALWCSIKPDVQYIIHPGGADMRDALAFGIRTEISF